MNTHRSKRFSEPTDSVGEDASDNDAPTGGDAVTDEQLEADNDVERDTLRTLEPDNPP